MFQVPKSFASTIQEIYVDGKMTFFKQLLQVVIGNYAVIFDIENERDIREVKYLENTDSFLNPEHYVQTGFVLASSHTDQEDGSDFTLRQSLVTNLHQNLVLYDEVKTW